MHYKFSQVGRRGKMSLMLLYKMFFKEILLGFQLWTHAWMHWVASHKPAVFIIKSVKVFCIYYK